MPFSTRVKSSLVLKLFSPWRWLIRSTDDIIFSKLNGLNSLNDAGFFLNWVLFLGFWGNHSNLLIPSAVQIEAGQILAEEVAAQTCACLLLLIIYGVRLLLRLSFAFKSAKRQDPLCSDVLTFDKYFCVLFWFLKEFRGANEETKRILWLKSNRTCSRLLFEERSRIASASYHHPHSCNWLLMVGPLSTQPLQRTQKITLFWEAQVYRDGDRSSGGRSQVSFLCCIH